MNLAAFHEPKYFPLGRSGQNCRSLCRRHFNGSFAYRTKGLEPFARAAVRDGFAEFNFDLGSFGHEFLVILKRLALQFAINSTNISFQHIIAQTQYVSLDLLWTRFGHLYDIF